MKTSSRANGNEKKKLSTKPCEINNDDVQKVCECYMGLVNINSNRVSDQKVICKTHDVLKKKSIYEISSIYARFPSSELT